MKPQYLDGNRVRLLRTGQEFFPALLKAIAQAKTSIHLETYIYANDATGQAVATALIAAAQRGVSVHVMVDGFGSPDFLAAPGVALIAAGVSILIYRPEVAGLPLRRNRLRRLHRKLSVFDGRLAFVGGINIVDDDPGRGLSGPRFDYAVAVEGPLLAPIRRSAHRLWRLVRWANFRRRIPERLPDNPVTDVAGPVAAAWLVRDNLRHRRDILDAYLDAIANATDEVVLANAYFLPGRRFRRALLDAAARGVKVTVLLQGHIEYFLQHFATQALYGQLVAGGVHIHEYRRSFLHAKVAVIDRQWATVGSSNIDPFSLLMAREANVVVRHAGFATELHESLESALANDSIEIRHEDLKRRSWWSRGASWLAYSAVRFAIGVVGGGGLDYRR